MCIRILFLFFLRFVLLFLVSKAFEFLTKCSTWSVFLKKYSVHTFLILKWNFQQQNKESILFNHTNWFRDKQYKLPLKLLFSFYSTDDLTPVMVCIYLTPLYYIWEQKRRERTSLRCSCIHDDCITVNTSTLGWCVNKTVYEHCPSNARVIQKYNRVYIQW